MLKNFKQVDVRLIPNSNFRIPSDPTYIAIYLFLMILYYFCYIKPHFRKTSFNIIPYQWKGLFT